MAGLLVGEYIDVSGNTYQSHIPYYTKFNKAGFDDCYMSTHQIKVKNGDGIILKAKIEYTHYEYPLLQVFGAVKNRYERRQEKRYFGFAEIKIDQITEGFK